MLLFTSILIFLAVIPGLFLLKKVYDMDSIEKEPRDLLKRLFLKSLISILIAMVIELAGSFVLGFFFSSNTMLYRLLLCFVIIGPAEEYGKYYVLKKNTWNHPAFDYVFDGVVYAACVGVGFAVFENLKYVLKLGIGTALVRAITAVPAHAIFAIFMGHYYGLAKQYDRAGSPAAAASNRLMCLLVPVLLHGLYDYIALSQTTISVITFFAFVIILDIVTLKKIKHYSKEDRPL